MGCESSMKLLPLIDFSDLKQETPTTWESVKIQVREALEEYGSFEARFDDITPHLRQSVVDGIQQLFDLPLHIKSRTRSNKPYLGYIEKNASAPLYESLGIEDALSPGKIDAFTNLLWPHGNPTFSKSVESFAEQLCEVDKTVRRMVAESLGLEKYMDSTNYNIVRFQKYEAPRSLEAELGLSSHTDKNAITILYQYEVRGLQVQTKDGKWIDARPNSFIVLFGDAFQAWTNGRVRSTYHRVMMSGDEARYSIGLFSVPKPGYIIKAPEETVIEE